MRDLGVKAEVTVDGSASASLAFGKPVGWFWLWRVVCDGGYGFSPSICCYD